MMEAEGSGARGSWGLRSKVFGSGVGGKGCLQMRFEVKQPPSLQNEAPAKTANFQIHTPKTAQRGIPQKDLQRQRRKQQRPTWGSFCFGRLSHAISIRSRFEDLNFALTCPESL